MIGETLGPYLIERELGVGGMGKVYAATVTGRAPGIETGTRVALKLVHSHLLETPGFFKRFLREADVGKSVQHENVVRTFDADALLHGGAHHHFLVMEFVEGQTLREVLVELNRLPEELCRHIGREVAKGLAAIHGAAVVHRDLKPENVIVARSKAGSRDEDDFVVKVMDLGVAQLQDEAIRLSQTGAFVGSVQYAAPEQFGGAEVDHRADLHALGLMLYELGCGQQPYYDEDFRVALHRLLKDEPRRVSEINPQLSPFYEEVVHTLIAKDKEDRFATATELAEILEEGEDSEWWNERKKALRIETKQPLRRIRVPRETALYGRDGELARLRALFEQVKAGDGRVLLLEGEAGIGKTRLVDEFMGCLRQEGEDLSFLFGTYPPGGAAGAGGAFSTAFREHMGPDGSAPYLTEAPLMVEAFDAMLRGDGTPTGATPLTKQSLVTCFVHATRALAAERPTVLLIDDLQFAPEDARNLFSAIALAVPGHRVFLVGTVRPGVSQEWHANIVRLEHAEQLSLPRLGTKDLVHLLKDTFRSERLATELGLQIAIKSDGNPYYVFEIVRGLREGQYITQADDGTWGATQVIDRIQIPSSVMDLIQARITDLTAEEKELLDVAACCGFEFDPGLVAEALGMRRIPALRTFGSIETAHRLIRSVGRNFTFDHYQVQEALYEKQPEQLREEYHAAIAAALEEREEAAEIDLEDLDGAVALEICTHYLKGARGRKAKRYLGAAMSQLAKSHVHDTIAKLAGQALDTPRLFKGKERLDLLLRRARHLDFLGSRERQRACLDEALQIAEGLDDPSAAPRVRVQIARHLIAIGRYAEASEMLERAREQADAAEELELVLEIVTNQEAVLWMTGEYVAALAMNDRRAAMLRDAGKDAAEAEAVRATIFSLLGRWQEAGELHRRVIERAKAEGKDVGGSQANYGLVNRAQGRYRESIDNHEAHLSQARRTGERQSEGIALVNLGRLYAELGDLGRGRKTLERCLKIVRETVSRRVEGYALHRLAEAFLRAGEAEPAERHLGDALALRREINYRKGVAETLAAKGSLLASQGRSEEAGGALSESLAIARELDAPGVLVTAACHLAALGGIDVSEALEELAKLEERMPHIQRIEARFLLWNATGDRAHLAEAHRLLAFVREHAPPVYRDTVIENVPLHRDVWAATEEAGS